MTELTIASARKWVRHPPGLLQTTWLLLRKDLLIEWRTRARMNALVFFAIATLLLFSFALGPSVDILRSGAAGCLWLGILLASVLALGESFRIEAENAALDGIRLAPADPRALFLGKALGNALLLVALAVVLLPVMIALYDVRLFDVTLAERTHQPAWQGGLRAFWHLLPVVGLGCLAISGPGTIYAAVASHARARDVLLPLLLFPLLIPALLAAVKATGLVLGGDPMDQIDSWRRLLVFFDLIYWGLGFTLFPRVVED